MRPGEWLRFYIEPVAKPRMTRRDKWMLRKPVAKYRAYRDFLLLNNNPNSEAGPLKLPDRLTVRYYITMPKSWSKKKKAKMCKKPHQQTPDLDNFNKAILDAFCGQDNYVWDINAKKFWAEEGCVRIKLVKENYEVKVEKKW